VWRCCEIVLDCGRGWVWRGDITIVSCRIPKARHQVLSCIQLRKPTMQRRISRYLQQHRIQKLRPNLLLLRHMRREIVVRVIYMHKRAIDIWYTLCKPVSTHPLQHGGFDLPRTYCRLSPKSWLSLSARCSSTTISTSTFNLSPA
jgi:hypothetical protein